jgi:RNA polymerase sigma-70 factor (ECF subfamily)
MSSPNPRQPLELVPSHESATVANAELVRDVVAGRPAAAASLWKAYGGLVYRIAERAMGSPHDAEDIAQDVFLQLFNKLGQLRDPGALRSFIVSVTVRMVRWKLRRRRLRQWVGLTESGQVPDLPSRGIDTDQALTRFYSLLDQLPVEDRMIFVLRRVDGMQLDEVAAAMGLSLATVKRRLCRADAKLSGLMEAEPVLVMFLHRGGSV